MRVFTSLLVLASSGALHAQIENMFEVYPDTTFMSTSFASRFLLGTLPGEMHMEFPGGSFRGLGDNGSQCHFINLRLVLQDANAATPDSFGVIIRRSRPTVGGPDVSQPPIFQLGPFGLPPGNGTQAWELLVNIGAAGVAVPCDSGWCLGVSVGVASNTDGLFSHTANYVEGAVGDNPRRNAPNLSWQVQGLAVAQPTARVTRFAANTVSAVLNMGGVDPNNTRITPNGSPCFGAGGLFPDISGAPRQDGIDARVFDLSNNGGVALAFMGRRVSTQPALAVPGIGGRFYLDTNFFLVGVAPIAGQSARASMTIVPAFVLGPELRGVTLAFQALTVDMSGSLLRFTNEARVSL